MGTTRRQYTAEFNRDAVALVTVQGYAVAAAARNVGITPKLLSRWKGEQQRHQEGTFPGQGREPRWLVTDKMRSYAAAYRTIMPTVHRINEVYANNRAEVSHEPTRERGRAVRGFRSSDQAQRFLTLHGLTQNLFLLGRHLSCRWSTIGSCILKRSKFGRTSCAHEV